MVFAAEPTSAGCTGFCERQLFTDELRTTTGNCAVVHLDGRGSTEKADPAAEFGLIGGYVLGEIACAVVLGGNANALSGMNILDPGYGAG